MRTTLQSWRWWTMAMLFAICGAGVGGVRFAAAQEAPPAVDGAPATDPAAATGSDESLAQIEARLAERFARLETLVERQAELSRGTQPRRATLLRQLITQSRSRDVNGQFNKVIAALEQESFSSAIDGQASLETELNKLLELLLQEDRDRQIDSERKRVSRYLQDVNRLIRLQRGVKARTDGGDDDEELSKDQQAVGDKTDKLGDEIEDSEKTAAQKAAESRESGEKDSESPPSESGESESQAESESKGEEGKQSKSSEGKESSKSDEAEKSEESSEEESNEGKPSDDDSKEESKPSDSKQSESKPSDGESKPSESGESESSESQPSESQPSEGQPSQSKPSQGSPSEQQPGQSGEQSPQNGEQPPDNPMQRAAQKLRHAQQRMAEAQKKLEESQRDGAVEEQSKAVEELEQAKAELERILRQLREEELERMLVLLEARFRKMLDEQIEVYDETKKLDAASQKAPSHELEIASGRLARKETLIVREADRALVLLREDGTSTAFPEAIEQARDDMESIAERLRETRVDLITQGLEEDVIAALEETLAALQQALKDLREQKQQGQPQQGGGEPGEKPLVDQLAELRMIRSLQVRVNKRTQQYGAMIEGEQAEDTDLIEAIEGLAVRQQKIFQATRELNTKED
ncbi:hypothetical protein [Lacipirellula parvula]|uniref:Uncharacterized protein n=1 Tax=Lacipirellula parvula TaxID=2650471 RepID=A0A5K7X903_9BACT|nr:hypothetical protein [Lacipirellula parvula]BBO33264.1 hypothetical protein PLANPX_2876 [Lacipirellula parvula]